MKPDVLIKRTNYLIFTIVIFYTISQLTLYLTLGDEWIERNYYPFLVFIQLIIIMLPVLIFLYRYKLNPVKAFRIKKITGMEAFLIVMMAVSSSLIASVLNAAVIYFLEKIGTIPLDNVPTPQSIPELWIQILVIALIPAICEELFFRGIIYGSYKGMGARMSIFISAFYFALFHFDIRNLLGPFLLGLLLAWYCYRTGSVFAGIVAHFTNNLLAVLINWYNRDIIVEQMVLTEETMGQLFVLALVVGCILVILMKAFVVITRKEAKMDSDEGAKLPLSLIAHWPMWFFYAAYLVITVRLLTLITKPLL